ncbi:hypothetical protein UFOVP231_10 [uncultured Caudovirales phage]|uniref:Uncharacterized protein n=1 Tax=uncultured Caudovirales phage TaxID=2100421 RepID=A0A6J7WSY1_9CAUD|nr:hypothetical protein UFOVP231_10 [uncultured Caudovirales phage]
MSDMAKEARKAMKAKAQRLGSDRPLEKVDSSTWTPPAMLNADVKTGLRPISRRAFKSGGKVGGEAAHAHMGKKPRQSGGKALTADSFINKNVKEANESREGAKHIGALKTGGRAKKMDGGIMSPAMSGAAKMMARGQAVGNIPGAMLQSQPTNSRLARSTGLKKGGKAMKHDDVAEDKALIKKMVKPSARTGKDIGGEADSDGAMKKGGRAHRATGGQVFSGPGYPGKVPGADGGRTAHARGGKARGKTDINIMVGAHPPAGAPMGVNPMGGPTKPPGMPDGPGGIPVQVPPAAGAPAGGMPMPMPMPIPMPGPAGPAGPPGMPPMGRKRGGRTYKSYKDMDAGAANGFGRLEKAEIASKTARIEKGNY